MKRFSRRRYRFGLKSQQGFFYLRKSQPNSNCKFRAVRGHAGGFSISQIQKNREFNKKFQESRVHNRNSWFQHNSVTCSTSNESMRVVRNIRFLRSSYHGHRGATIWVLQTSVYGDTLKVNSNNTTSWSWIFSKKLKLKRLQFLWTFSIFLCLIEECSNRQRCHL